VMHPAQSQWRLAACRSSIWWEFDGLVVRGTLVVCCCVGLGVGVGFTYTCSVREASAGTEHGFTAARTVGVNVWASRSCGSRD